MSKNATGISGFFSPAENPDELFEPEISLMHRNEDGPFELYKCEGRGRITVLKAIRREDRDNPLYNEMLRKEFEIGCSLNHPNIREYYSMQEFPGLGMCVEMEWIDARTLEEVLDQCRRDRRFCDGIASQLLDAVHILHLKQVVHRDLKPSNILITRKGNNVKLIDFSLSDTDSHLILKGNAGTPLYASPEQVNCKESDYRSDIYSLGVILSRMSFRRRYRKTAQKCLRENPADRFSNVAELKAELFRPSRTPWVYAAVFVLTVVFSAFALVRNFEHQDAAEEEPEVMLPDRADEQSPAEERQDSSPERAADVEPEEKSVDAGDIDNLFREATDLFEGIQ